MFTLHEITRRTLCRLGFIVLCLGPMCAVLAASVWVGSANRVIEHERALTERLGLAVSIERVVYPRPGFVRYESVTLADPETTDRLVVADSLELTTTDNVTTIAARNPRVNSVKLDGLLEVISRELRIGTTGSALRIAAGELALHPASGDPVTLHRVQLQFDYTASAAQAAVTFRTAEAATGEPVAMRLVRNRQAKPAAVGFEINTADAELPCSLLTAVMPTLTKLGAQCQFQGGMWAVLSADGWNGELAGRFVNVDLASLVSEQFPKQLAGNARLTIDRARLQAGRLEASHGTLESRGGTIHRALAGRLLEHLQLSGAKVESTFGVDHPYEELAVGFAVDPQGLRISGRCAKSPGALLVDPFGVAIRESSTGGRVPLADVAAMLVPTSDGAVPITRMSARIINVLPLPETETKRR